ncbi:MAG: tetratricopeptide repeat protein [Marinobacter sp.]|uniref:tetratricopeptide repeat protein n=1 Tax=Marinobacter sp. TaxID=50741 RepID=UPI00299F1284|nr:tetratricopeptide repeat protein [Marinobacter sp.]MDX1633170.1 tetratricopeptide repeat protein [Marinobacter sp.]
MTRALTMPAGFTSMAGPRLRPVIFGLLAVLLWPAPLAAQEAFQVNLAEDGDTIGDMRPVFLKFSAEAMPRISPKEVARRYQRLFDESDEPEVRIDALNRLANLQAEAGDLLTLSAEQEASIYREAIDSYEMIVSSGSFKGRLDELLYQSAKAYAYIGREAESVARLKQLVGLYPSSELAPEARFRIAEAAYSDGSFTEAEAGYRQVLAASADARLKSHARYMLGWAQFKQGARDRAGETFLSVLDEYSEQSGGFDYLPTASAEVIRDTFRIVGILAANGGGETALADLLDRAGERTYDFLLYDTLADYYAARGNYQRSVAVAEAFLARSPQHPSAPALMAQIVAVWERAGDNSRARHARADYVAAYPPGGRELAPEDLDRWLTYARTLADYHYHRAGQATPPDTEAFATAAGYYQSLAQRHRQPGPIHRLAGDAWLQAGQASAALAMFEQAGFEDPAFEGAADAAWAAVKLRVDNLTDGSIAGIDLDELSHTADRFATVFPQDQRLPALEADLANRLLAAGRNEQAARYASRAVVNDRVQPADAYSAWLVKARVDLAARRYGAAEQAWREALALAGADGQRQASGMDADAVLTQLATTIYRQAEAARDSGNVDQAVAHFQRISSVDPGSTIALKGRYDAATTLLQADRWQAAINELQRFRSDHPDHELTPGIADKLVYAYEASGQPVRAADELMAASAGAKDPWSHRLRAAELYHAAAQTDSRNAIYRDYLAQASAPADKSSHLSQQQMRQRLLESGVDADRLRQALVTAELASGWHSEQSLGWAAEAALVLAGQAGDQFREVRLTLPLSASLSRKQRTLEEARERYRQAETLGGERVRSRSLYHRAELYRVLAADIRESSLPDGLTELEAAQYRLLLDEQAYPFEDKAIELHAANHQLVSEGIYDTWVRQSIEALAALFPGRYARKPQWISLQQEPSDDA